MNHWPMKPLLELTTIVTTRVEPFEGKRCYVPTAALNAGKLTAADEVDFSSKPSRADVIAREGDIIFARMQATNKVTVVTKVTQNYIWSTGFAALRPSRYLRSRYLMYYVASPYFQLIKDKYCTGATQKSLTNAGISEITIPLPSLEQQDRIIELLDEAGKLRELRAQAERRTAEFIPALFHQMFGDPVANSRKWKRQAFGELLDRIDSGWSPICQDRPPQSDEWGVVKLGAVTTCEYLDTETKAMLAETAPRSEFEIKVGDVLFSRKNTYELVAACAFVFKTRPKLMLSDLIFRFRFRADAQLDPIFLWGLLTERNKRKQIQAMAGGSAGSMPNISKGRLITLPIELPPLPLQKEFAERVKEIRALETAQTRSRARLDALFASLLDKAFKGEL